MFEVKFTNGKKESTKFYSTMQDARIEAIIFVGENDNKEARIYTGNEESRVCLLSVYSDLIVNKESR